MFYVEKTIEVAVAHHLSLNYESKCTRIHGHNLLVTVYCKSKELNENGRVVDFSDVSKIVKQKLDHQYVNNKVDFNPTAENIARWLCEQIPHCYKVSVRESERNMATYERDD